MDNAINTIMDRLAEIFGEMDAKVLSSSLVWAAGRTAAIKEFEAIEENKVMRSANAWEFYKRVYNIAGGKTWYGICGQNGPARRDEFVTKNCAATAASRNAKIAKQLAKAEVTEVEGSEFVWTADGFNGIFRVSTNAGSKVVKINTVYAGGYNIQCLHLRVLVSVK